MSTPIKPHFRPMLIAALCFAMLACSTATIISYINTALQVGLEAASVTGIIPPIYSAYVSAALGCIDFAATETASMDSNAAKSATITAKCASLAAVNLPPGFPQNLASLAANLATKISSLLAHLPAQAPVGGLAAGKPEYMKLSGSDRAKLGMISSKAKAAQAKMDGALLLQRQAPVTK